MHRTHELKIDAPLAILLALVAFALENLDFPHSRIVGLITLGVSVWILIRILRILAARADIPFKNAPEFTWLRRQVIKHDIAWLREYFADLQIPTPETIPPFTVVDGGQATFTPGHDNRGELKIPSSQVANRKEVTHLYAVHVMNCAFPDLFRSKDFDPRNPTNALQLFQNTFFSTELREYFHASYWGSIDEKNERTGAMILWKIRATFGRKFGDRLASRVFRVAVDSPGEVIDHDANISLAKALEIAYGTLEASQQKWPKIQGIVEENRFYVRFTLRGPSRPQPMS